jgi:BASS family bile acid:Na+ symporter
VSPAVFGVIAQYLFPAIVFTIMFGMGLSLVGRDFGRIAASPRAVVVGLTIQLLIVPLVAVGLGHLLPFGPDVAVGLVLLAACPGGATSNAISLAAKADVALAVVLTAASSLFVAFTLPLWTVFATEHFLNEAKSFHLPVGETMTHLLLLTVLPSGLGMIVRRLAPTLATGALPTFRWLAMALIGLMCLLTTVFNGRYLADPKVLLESFVGCLALMTLAMGAGALLSRLAGLDVTQTMTIVIEVGVHNLAIGLLIAVTVLGDPAITRLPLVYGLLMLILPWLFIAGFKRRNAEVISENPQVGEA